MPRKTKAQLEAAAKAAIEQRETDAATAIMKAGISADAAQVIMLMIMAGKVPGVSFTP